MKYMITHSCGHCVEHALFGPTKDRQRKIEWMETIPCPECQKVEDQKAREEKAKEMGLPELTGTEKQVAWAQKIRDGYAIVEVEYDHLVGAKIPDEYYRWGV